MDSVLIVWYLESIAIRAIGLFAIAATLMLLLRVKSAGARHALWTLVTAGMLMIAITPPLMPGIAWRVLNPAPVSVSVSVSQVIPSIRIGDTVASRPISTPSVERPFPWETALAGLWAAGALLMIGRLAYGYGFAIRMVRAAREVEPGVRESDWIAVPVTVASMVVLPAAWREWSTEKRDAVLAHERAHVRRHDWAIAVMAAVNRALFWFHPLAWYLERRLASLAEEACDDAAIAEVGSRETYAQALVEIAATVKDGAGRLVWEAMAMARGAEVRNRVERILDDARELSRGVSWKRWVAMAGCGVPVVWLASVVHLARVQAATGNDAPIAVEQVQDSAGQEVRAQASMEKLRELEAAIAAFKMQNMGRLPEQFQGNVAQLQSTQMQLVSVNETMNRLQRQKMQLETQLQNATTLLNYNRASQNSQVGSLHQRIEDLRSSLASAKDLYTPSHPQIRKIELAIATLEAELETAQEPAGKNPSREELELQNSLNLLKTQIQMTNLELDEKVKQEHDLQRQISSFNSRIEIGPQLEMRYAELMRQYQRAKEELDNTSATGPQLLTRTEPEATGIQGKVELAVTIGTDGIARDMQVVHSPNPALNQKAMDCVAKWRFRPAMRAGQAVTAFASVEVNFK